MNRLLVGGIAGIAAAALLPGGAGARQAFDTEIEVVGNNNYAGDRLLVYGTLESDKARCESARSMQFLSNQTGAFEPLDTDRSSRNGAWSFDVDIDDVDTAKIKVARATAGNDTCRAAKLILP